MALETIIDLQMRIAHRLTWIIIALASLPASSYLSAFPFPKKWIRHPSLQRWSTLTNIKLQHLRLR